MKNTLHFFLIIIFLFSGTKSFAEKKSNDSYVCPTASISYTGNPFCTSMASPQAVTLTGTDAYLGGVFSSTAGLTINSNTGEILPSTSTPGIYTVSYTIPSGPGCPSITVTTTIEIILQPNAGTDGSTTVCETSPFAINLFSLITGEQAGGTWTQTSGTGGTLNAAAGTFTPGIGATPYTITYTIIGTAPCVNDTSVATINIIHQPNAGTNGGVTICDNGTIINLFDLITGEESGGTWTQTSGSGGTFNAVAGTYTPAAGATTSTFTYTLVGAAPCYNDSSVATVTYGSTATGIYITGNNTICGGSSANLTITGTPNATITMTNGSFQNTYVIGASGHIVISVLPTTTTTYTLLSSSFNGCIFPISGQSFTITVYPVPSITSIVTNTNSICDNQFVTITTNSNASGTVYNWYVNQANGVQVVGGVTSGTSTTGIINLQLALTNPLVAGTISFSLAPINGYCIGLPMYTNTITVNPIPSLPIGLPIDEICSGSQLNIASQLTSTVPGTIFVWSASTTNVNMMAISGDQTNIDQIINLVNPSQNGTISFLVMPQIGNCFGGTTEYTILVNPLPNLLNLTDGEITIDGNGNLVPFVLDTGLDNLNYSFEWYLNDVLIPSATSNTYTATEIGNYSVVAINTVTNCMNQSNASVSAGLANNEDPVELITFTNPLLDTLNFTNNNKVKTIKISNQMGQTVLINEVNLKNGTIDISVLNMGIYNIESETEAGIVIRRIMKQ